MSELLVRVRVNKPGEPERWVVGAISTEDPAIRAYGDQRAAEVLRPFEELFAGGPDTSCRTTWPDGLECVEVPINDLRAAFADAPSIRERLRAASERASSLPPRARPVVTRPFSCRGRPHEGGAAVSDEELRERLAAALDDGVIVPVERGPVLDALLPVVRAYGDQRAAEALREAGKALAADQATRLWDGDVYAPADTPEAHRG